MTTGADSGPGIGRAKVIIVPEDPTQEPVRIDVDGLEYHYQRGVCRVMPDAGKVEICYEPNGQMRLQILAWRGCGSFDAFEPVTQRDPVVDAVRERFKGSAKPETMPPCKMADGRTVAQVAKGPLPLRKSMKGANSGGDDMA